MGRGKEERARTENESNEFETLFDEYAGADAAEQDIAQMGVGKTTQELQ